MELNIDKSVFLETLDQMDDLQEKLKSEIASLEPTSIGLTSEQFSFLEESVTLAITDKFNANVVSVKFLYSTTGADDSWQEIHDTSIAYSKLWMKVEVTLLDGSIYITAPTKLEIASNLEDGGTDLPADDTSESTEKINVVFVEDASQECTAQDTLYFFSKSLLQGVGSYNNLLLENNEDYSVSNLYLLNKDGNYSIVYDSTENPIITVLNNRIYCYSLPTPIFLYGKVLVDGKIKYADTSDTAYLTLWTSGPFFAETTKVTLKYDTSLIKIKYKDLDNTWKNVDAGITFTQKDFCNLRYLKIVRINPSENNSLKTTITFNNGYEDTDVTIMYSEYQLFYKNGVCYNDFSVDAPIKTSNVSIKNLDTLFNYEGRGTLTISKNFSIDLRKFNMLYAVFTEMPLDISMFWNTENSDVTNYTYGRGDSVKTNVYYPITHFDEASIKGPVHNFRSGGIYNFALKLYKLSSSSTNQHTTIREIGILTYNEP